MKIPKEVLMSLVAVYDPETICQKLQITRKQLAKLLLKHNIKDLWAKKITCSGCKREIDSEYSIDSKKRNWLQSLPRRYCEDCREEKYKERNRKSSRDTYNLNPDYANWKRKQKPKGQIRGPGHGEVI